MEYLLLILGFVLLIKGADMFVGGASNIAKYFKIPSIIIGLTLVAFGTSAPEAAVSITAAINKSADIAISNIVGSNIFNLLCVLGITSLFTDVKADKEVICKDYKLSIFCALLLLVLILVNFIFGHSLVLGRVGGIILLIVLGFYLYNMIKNAKIDKEENNVIQTKFNVKDVIFVIIGLAMVVFGGDLTVDNATLIAKAWGMSERFIGLTIVAMGTSLPELCTSLVALYKGENDIAVGNVIGSNIFNILFILGATSFISPLNIGIESIIDLMILIVGCIGVLFMFDDLKIKKHEGISMLMFYVTYCIYIFIR
jgi:cation:H+ antiporter